MTPMSTVLWFSRAYQAFGFEGCSSHSGGRTFITRAAATVHKAGGSLQDVQLLAGYQVFWCYKLCCSPASRMLEIER
jgi:integrase/recombinase XerD